MKAARDTRATWVIWGILALCSVALLVYLLLGVGLPYLAARSAVQRCYQKATDGKAWPHVVEAEIQRMGGQERAAQAIAHYAKLPDCLAANRPVAVRMLGCCGAFGESPLLEFAQHRDATIRCQALYALGCPQSGRFEEVAERAVKDPDAAVRVQLALVLATAHDGSSLRLLRVLLADSDPHVAVAAISALGGQGGAAVDDLARVARNATTREELRLAAVAALVRQDSEEAWQHIAWAAKNGSESVKAAARSALEGRR